MKSLILITTLLLSGCGIASYSEQEVQDAFMLCNPNGGVKIIKLGYLFFTRLEQITCNNGAVFEIELGFWGGS